MIKGIVCSNLERRSGKMAAGCAKVNGIAAKESQISPATCKFCPGAGLAGGRVGASPSTPPGSAQALLHARVVLLPVNPRTLPILGPLHIALLGSTDVPVGSRIGLLAIDMGLAALQ